MQRIFESLPGTLTWLTFFLMIILSWKAPFWISIFFILYSFFWVVRIFYLHFHLRHSFDKMRRNMKIDWLQKLKNLKAEEQTQDFSWEDICHLVILPTFKEPYSVLRESLLKLIGSNYPKEKMILVLGVEERGGKESLKVAEKILNEFGKNFLKTLITIHPDGLSGEIPGKGSNETWAARKAKTEIIDPLKIPYERILVSVFDADTQVYPDYFGILSYLFLTSLKPQNSSYQPIPLFLNNIFAAPVFSRVMAFFPTFWQMMQQSRVEQLTTFTSQAMPWKALVEVDFWDTNLVSEDSLIFWKFYLHYDGDWKTEPLLYPVSLDANVASSLWQTAKNLYKQQRRWAWGVENIPYMLNGFRKNKKIKLRKKIFWTYIFLEGFYSWATSPFVVFTLGWLPPALGGDAFNSTLLSYNLPKITSFVLNFSVFGLAASAILSTVFLMPKPDWFKKRHYLIYFLQWALVPVVVIIFSAIPGIEAQTRMILGGKFRLGFWPTPKDRGD